MTKIGSRVGAILKANSEEVHLLGYGVYDGKFSPPRLFGMSLEEYRGEVENNKAEFPENPRITLDDGRVVWGSQCWWGPEDKVKKLIGERKIIPAMIE